MYFGKKTYLKLDFVFIGHYNRNGGVRVRQVMWKQVKLLRETWKLVGWPVKTWHVAGPLLLGQ